MQQLGALLKTEREKRGIRLADIASVTKIQIHHLREIEEGNWKALPAKPFVKGFLSAYARYVGLNPQEIYQLYLSELKAQEPVSTETGETPVEEIAPTPIRPESKVLQLKPLVFTALGLFVVFMAFWIIRLGKEVSAPTLAENANATATATGTVEAQVPVVPAPEVASPEVEVANPAPTAAPEPERAVASEPAPAATAPVAPAAPIAAVESGEGHALKVTAKERTWVKIVIDDAPPVEYYLKPDEKSEYTAKNKIKLVLGNASGAEVIHNGTVEDGAKYQGTIRYYIFPKGSRFPQDKPRQPAGGETISENSFPSEKLPDLPNE